MNLRDRAARLIREVFALDPDALTDEQFVRAAKAACRTEWGRESEKRRVRELSNEELDDECLEDTYGIDPTRLTPEQRERLLDRVDAEFDATSEEQGP